MDEAKQQISNQEAVAGQVGTNYGTVIQKFNGTRKKPRSRSPSSLDRAWTVPYHRNQVFTGREDLLHELHHRLTTTRTAALTQPQAMSGLGGIGKTQVAIEYAYRYGEEYHDVLWIDAATRETLVSGFLELAVLFDLPEQQEQDQNKVIAAVKQWFISHRQWLLIFDNADDLTLAEEFLPTSNTGYIILTTRYQARRTFATSLNFETMSIQEGALLLLRRANLLGMDTPLDQTKPAYRTQAESIVTAVDGLPLALDQAGAYIEETQCALATYLETYQRRQTELLQRRGDAGKAHPDPVATTWSLSFAKVEQLNPLAADLLRFCAFLAPDDIPEQLIIDGAAKLGSHLQSLATDPSLLDEAIGMLLRFSLVKRKRDEQTIAVHRLVQAVQRTNMDKRTQQLWAKRAIHALNLAFPEVDYTNLQKCQLYLPQVQNCVSLIAQWKFAFSEAAQLFIRTGEYLTEIAQYEQAEGYYQRALAIREKVAGPEHPDTVAIRHRLTQY